MEVLILPLSTNSILRKLQVQIRTLIPPCECASNTIHVYISGQINMPNMALAASFRTQICVCLKHSRTRHRVLAA